MNSDHARTGESLYTQTPTANIILQSILTNLILNMFSSRMIIWVSCLIVTLSTQQNQLATADSVNQVHTRNPPLTPLTHPTPPLSPTPTPPMFESITECLTNDS